MALTDFQSRTLRLLEANRRKTGGSYVAGGLALNLSLDAPRESHDIDIFHDSAEALLASWNLDRETLMSAGYSVMPIRENKTFIEATIEKDGECMEIQWGIDSAYRFFPLVEDETTGFTLHPLDLATNKLAALVGRTEPRDWIDVITSIQEIQPMLYLISAACGKDPGFSPPSMLEYVARRRYTQVELDDRIIPKGTYDAASLCRFWRESVEKTREALPFLPAEEAGKAVLDRKGRPFRGDPERLPEAIAAGDVVFHEGRICGAWPRVL